jgi:hypothetical protein
LIVFRLKVDRAGDGVVVVVSTEGEEVVQGAEHRTQGRSEARRDRGSDRPLKEKVFFCVKDESDRFCHFKKASHSFSMKIIQSLYSMINFRNISHFLNQNELALRENQINSMLAAFSSST